MTVHHCPRVLLYYCCGAMVVLCARHMDAAPPPADATASSTFKLLQAHPASSPTPPSSANGTTLKASFPFPPLWNVWPPPNADAERKNASRGAGGVDLMPLFVRPFASLFDSLQRKNASDDQQKSVGKAPGKAGDAAQQPKIDARVAESFLNYIFDISTTTTTQAPPPSVMLMRTFFEPIVNSIRRDLQKKAEVTETYSALPAPVQPSRPRANGIPTTLFNVDAALHKSADVNEERRAGGSTSVRRSPVARAYRTIPTTREREASEERGSSPIASLLQFIGMDSRAKKEEVQIGRDRSVSVLGMPVGQRDGLALSPLKGVSLGNQEMFGPIAVNDRYNVKWDFLDNFGENFSIF